MAGSFGAGALYGGQVRNGVGAAPGTPQTLRQPAVAASAAGNQGDGGHAPTIAWVGILVALVLLRIAYEMGAEVGA